MSYATRYRLDMRGRDGFYYRADVEQRGYTGAVTMLAPGRLEGALRVAVGQRGRQPESSPLVPLTITLVTRASAATLEDVQTAAPATYRVRYQRSSDGVSYAVLMSGLVLPGRYASTREAGGDYVETLTATAGYELLPATPLVLPAQVAGGPAATITMHEALRQAAAALGHALPLTAAMPLRPYVSGDALSAVANPLRHLEVGRAAFEQSGRSGDAEAWDVQSAAVEVLARFGLRMMQSQGRWWLLRDFDVADGSVEAWDYASTWETDGGATGARTASKSVARTLSVGEGDPSGEALGGGGEVVPPLVTSEHVYDFSPDLKEIVSNGSFENHTGGVPEYWTLSLSATSDATATLLSSASPTFNNARAVKMPARTSGDWAAYGFPAQLVQEGRIQLPGSKGAGLTVRASGAAVKLGGGDVRPDMMLAVEAVRPERTFVMRLATSNVATSYRGARVPIAVSFDGSGLWRAGTTLVPRGARLRILVDNTRYTWITLSQDYRAGESQIVGSLQDDITGSGDHVIYLPVWVDTTSSLMDSTIIPQWIETPELTELEWSTNLVAVQNGETVTGHLRIRSGVKTTLTYNAGRYGVLDYVSAEIIMPGARTVGAYSALGQRVGGEWGDELRLGHHIGDGPTPETDTRLRLRTLSGALHDTFQGESTAWKRGAYASGDSPDADRFSLDARLSAEDLYARPDARRRLTAPVHLRGGAELHPHELVTYDGRAWRQDYHEMSLPEAVVTLELTQLSKDTTVPVQVGTVLVDRQGSRARFVSLEADGAYALAESARRGVVELGTAGSLTTTSADAGPGAITSIGVNATTRVTGTNTLPSGSKVLVAGLRGGVWEVTLSAAYAGGTTLSISSYDLGGTVIPAGSSVYPSPGWLTNILSRTREATYSLIKEDALALLSASYASATPITTLGVASLKVQLKAGQKIRVIRADGGSTSMLVRSDTAASSGSTTIPVYWTTTEATENGGTLTGTAPYYNVQLTASSGDGVHNDTGGRQTEYLQTATEISLRVLKSAIIAEINLSAEGVKITGDRIQLNGVVEASHTVRSAAVSTYAGDPLWAISGNGGIALKNDTSASAYDRTDLAATGSTFARYTNGASDYHQTSIVGGRVHGQTEVGTTFDLNSDAGTYTIGGQNILTATSSLNASNLGSGTVPAARLTGTYSIDVTSVDGYTSTQLLNASNLNSGTVAIARLPTGTTSTTVALGNHTHAASEGYVKWVTANLAGAIPSGTSYGIGTVVMDRDNPQKRWLMCDDGTGNSTAHQL